jgi:tetratricopeptide (TPR) repeat protein
MAHLLVAQSNEVDENSLYWKEIPASDSRESFKKLDKYFYKTFDWENDEDRIAFYKKGYEASLALELDTASFDYSRELGYLYTQMDSFELALMYLSLNLEYVFNNKSKSASYNLHSFLHSSIGDYSTALDYLFKSIDAGKLDGIRFRWST